MSSMNSQCETFIPMLDAFVDSELDVSEKAQVNLHVQSCDACKRQIKAIESLKASLAGLPRRKMSLDLADKFDNLLESKAESPALASDNVVSMPAKRRWVVGFASAAAVAVIALAGAMVSKGGHQEVANYSLPAHLQSISRGSSGKDAAQKNAVRFNPDTKKEQQPASNIAANNIGRVPPVVDSHSTGASVLSANGSDTVAQLQSSKTAVVAHENEPETVRTDGIKRDRSASRDLLALYEEDESLGSDIGMTTDEDGLYAIKL